MGVGCYTFRNKIAFFNISKIRFFMFFILAYMLTIPLQFNNNNKKEPKNKKEQITLPLTILTFIKNIKELNTFPVTYRHFSDVLFYVLFCLTFVTFLTTLNKNPPFVRDC